MLKVILVSLNVRVNIESTMHAASCPLPKVPNKEISQRMAAIPRHDDLSTYYCKDIVPRAASTS